MWELIRANRRKSMLLFILMGIGLILLGAAISYFVNPAGMGIDGIIIALLIWIVMALVSYYRGASILLSASKAKKVTPDVHPQLYNVVEEMKIAAGLPKMPDIYIINEEAPNAFAAGRDPDHAVIAVTAGLLARMNRDELQGVVAHEMAHIYNRDIRFMTLAGVMLGSIVLISQIFLRGMLYTGGGARYRSSNSGGGQGQILIMVLALVLAILVPIFAGLLYYSISRKREYLADATGVRFSRYPEGLASALEKIGAYPGAHSAAPAVTSPFYLVNPGRQALAGGAFATHPPLTSRIKVLRAMTQGAGYMEYLKAYLAVTHGRATLIAREDLRDADRVEIRTPAERPPDPSTSDVRRRAGEIIRAMNDFIFLTCPCGMKLKLPPEFAGKQVQCPRCKREHEAKKPDAGTFSGVLHSQAAMDRDVPGPARVQDVRYEPGKWQNFSCARCGHPHEISPRFGGTTLPSCVETGPVFSDPSSRFTHCLMIFTDSRISCIRHR